MENPDERPSFEDIIKIIKSSDSNVMYQKLPDDNYNLV